MEALSSQTLLQILDMVGPIAVFDKDGFYIYVNRSWRESSGVSLPMEELRRLHSWDIIPDSRLRIVLATGKQLIGEVIDVNRDKAYINYKPIRDKTGALEGVVMFQELLQDGDRTGKAEKLLALLRQELSEARQNYDAIRKEEELKSLITGDSAAMSALRREILDAARSNSTVLIEGETGTGKELVAQAIHRLGKSAKGKFVPVNCSAIPSALMESEFFGYEEGAFTGAKRGGHAGKIELAAGGTLFLDEVHQMDAFLQPKLLRALQEHMIERVGGAESIPVNFRCIAAANESLSALVEAGQFRDDLYYRLNVVHIDLPPLRERREDIPQLVNMFIAQLNARLETHIIAANDSTLQMLMEYDWPGNVRELQNAVEAAMNRAWDGILEIRHFRLDPERRRAALSGGSNYNANKQKLEKDMIREVLQSCDWNKSRAAARLGISRSVLYSKIKKYGL